MKLGVFSDVHLEFAWYDYRAQTERFPNSGERIPYVFAGDLGTVDGPRQIESVPGTATTVLGRLQADLFKEKHPEVLCWVEGNHDYYGAEFPRPGRGQGAAFVPGTDLVVAWATLWTDFGERYFDTYFSRGMADYRHIRSVTYEAYRAAHLSDLAFLRDSGADVIVTHHGPFPGSVHAKYEGDPFNWCFSCQNVDLNKFKKKPKLWIHGHTHESLDYVHEGVRVVCHPRGYPGETNFNGYVPKVIEI